MQNTLFLVSGLQKLKKQTHGVDMEITPKTLLKNVKKMVAAQILTPDYEVNSESFICFTHRNTDGTNPMYYIGKFLQFPEEIQNSFLGAYLNETIGDYKITGIYKIAKGL